MLENNLIKQNQPKYNILLKDDPKAPSGYQFVGFFNPDACREEDEPEWNVCVPIESDETIPEFCGW